MAVEDDVVCFTPGADLVEECGDEEVGGMVVVMVAEFAGAVGGEVPEELGEIGEEVEAAV